ncbi:MAG: hypothetical protein Ct9H90mP7_1150 [Candidatus Neomarinimicrobiota bacterium]|nr:MAG: hypothetical protein Ct9H90mP7_1150 [Candidatus Neomarinimicrobiota bacterium]
MNRQEFDIKDKDTGVLVTQIFQNTPADDAGIRVGIYYQGWSRRCSSVKQFDDLVRNSKRRGMLMLHIKRDGNAQYVTLDLKEK